MKTKTFVLFMICLGIIFSSQELKSQNFPYLLKDISDNVAAGEPKGLIVVGDYMVFGGDDGIHGRELWSTDGTEEGTIMLADINTSEHGSIAGIVDPNWGSFDGQCYFNAFSNTYGWECWVTDGTINGTRLLQDIALGFEPGCESRFFFKYKDHFYFSATDGGLWKSDGSDEGTALLKIIREGSINSYMRFPILFNDLMYFVVHDGIHGNEYWKTDGTVDGTVMAFDLNPDDSFAVGYPTVMDNTMYFTGNHPDYGVELFKSDGTAEGTHLVKEIVEDGHTYFEDFCECGGKLFFVADDFISGRELWVSDGSEEGTYMVKDIREGPDHSHPSDMECMDNKLYFSAIEEQYGGELWVSDGTEEGTHLVIDIGPGTNSNPDELFAINKTLFFRAHHPEFGVELFESDGTAEGTKVYNIHPTNHSTPRYFSNFKGELYFVAYDGTHGYEIFKLEGTWGEPELSAELPKVSVYPNPFDQNTMINWYLPDASKVEIRVFSMMGKEIAMLENGYRSRGNHQIAFNGSELPTGVYFCQIKVNDSIGTSKMMIMR